MYDFKELPQSYTASSILNEAFRTKNYFFDAGNGCVMPQKFRNISEKIHNFQIRSDDVFLCSYPRTGSTWLQEILWLLGNDLDFEKAKTINQFVRTPLFEMSCLFADDKEKEEWLK